MPYAKPDDAPAYVPEAKRSQWIDIWNSAFKKCQSDGGKDCEASAFRQANGVTLSKKLAELLSEVPRGTDKIPAALAVYLELPGARKDGECKVVQVDGGISLGKGCCDIWDELLGADGFRCGTCTYRVVTGRLIGAEGTMPKDCGEGKKAVGDECVARSKFAYVGDPDQKDSWSLPVHDKAHAQNAMARFNQTQVPSSAKSRVAARIASAAKHFGIDVAEFKKHLSEGGMSAEDVQSVLRSRLFATELVTLGESLDPIKDTYKIPVAYTGKFHKDGESFSISKDDLHSIVHNFKKRHNSSVNVDYEHASEMPEVAKGGPVPSSGEITDLSIEYVNGEPILMGAVGWTALARKLIESRQYRFFSPAIDWDAEDKETGEKQGATLTSAALTNRPFLEKLPPLLMSEVPRAFTEETIMANENRQFRIRKVKDDKGERLEVCLMGEAGATGDASFGKKMGEVFPKDWEDIASGSSSGTSSHHLAAAASPSSPSSPSSSSPSSPTTTGKADGVMKQMNNVLGESVSTLSEVRRLYMIGKQADQSSNAQKGHKLLSETVGESGWDKRKARALLSDGKVSPQQYAAFENAVELVQEGVDQGKIHPRQFHYFLTDAINRPAEFEAMIESALPYIDLSEHGLAGTDVAGRTTLAEGERAQHEIRQYMKDNKCSYTQALKALGKNPKFAKQFREAGRKQAARTM